MRRRISYSLTALLCCAAFAFCAAAQNRPAKPTGNRAERRVSTEQAGVVPTSDGLAFNLKTDTGSVRILSDASGEVRYRVRVEAQASDPNAEKLTKEFAVVARRTAHGVDLTGRMSNRGDLDRVWVTYEIHVPRRSELDVTTQAGDIETQDVEGRAMLTTGGGNIRTGRIGSADARRVSGKDRDLFAARLETDGGHIFAGDVTGGLKATTAGGHIVAGNVTGDAALRTGGGHIQVGRVSGTAQLSSGGGNIVAEGAGGGFQAESTGGRIELAEAAGSIHARSGGGGIRVARVTTATDIESSDGGMVLAGIGAPLRAASAAGGITAAFSPSYAGRRAAVGYGASEIASELSSGTGDLVVYLPPQMAVTVDAVVEQGSGHRIVADAALPLKVAYERSASGRVERGECAMNGGGEVIHLKAGAGNIQLRVLDAQTAQRLSHQQTEAVAQRTAAERALLSETADQAVVAVPAHSGNEASSYAGASGRQENGADESGWLVVWTRWFEGFWSGGVRVDSQEQQTRLIHAVPPIYPDAARQAGIEGDVTLRVIVGADGVVTDVRPLAGEAELARAAVDAVERWRYSPALLEGRAVSVTTTVTLAFRLQ